MKTECRSFARFVALAAALSLMPSAALPNEGAGSNLEGYLSKGIASLLTEPEINQVTVRACRVEIVRALSDPENCRLPDVLLEKNVVIALDEVENIAAFSAGSRGAILHLFFDDSTRDALDAARGLLAHELSGERTGAGLAGGTIDLASRHVADFLRGKGIAYRHTLKSCGGEMSFQMVTTISHPILLTRTPSPKLVRALNRYRGQCKKT